MTSFPIFYYNKHLIEVLRLKYGDNKLDLKTAVIRSQESSSSPVLDELVMFDGDAGKYYITV